MAEAEFLESLFVRPDGKLGGELCNRNDEGGKPRVYEADRISPRYFAGRNAESLRGHDRVHVGCEKFGLRRGDEYRVEGVQLVINGKFAFARVDESFRSSPAAVAFQKVIQAAIVPDAKLHLALEE
jgi:hypothetical protein